MGEKRHLLYVGAVSRQRASLRPVQVAYAGQSARRLLGAGALYQPSGYGSRRSLPRLDFQLNRPEYLYSENRILTFLKPLAEISGKGLFLKNQKPVKTGLLIVKNKIFSERQGKDISHFISGDFLMILYISGTERAASTCGITRLTAHFIY